MRSYENNRTIRLAQNVVIIIVIVIFGLMKSPRVRRKTKLTLETVVPAKQM